MDSASSTQNNKPDNLVKIYEGMIVPDQPLLLPLYSVQGELLAQKGTILDERQAIVVLRHGDIYTIRSELIEAVKGGFRSLSDHGEAIQYRFPPLFHQLEDVVKQLQGAYSPSDTPFVKRIEAIAKRFYRIITDFPEACLAYVVLNQQTDLFHHALGCAIVSHQMVRRLEWKHSAQDALVKAALTMDCGFIMEETAPDPSDPQYFRHQSTSHGVLAGLGVQEKQWLDNVAHHHCVSDEEAFKPSWGNSILFMADTFCSRLSGLYGDEKLRSHQVLGFLRGAFNSSMERLSFDALVSAFGVFPLGSIVLLRSGEIAVVTELTNHLEKPIVKAIYAKDGGRWQTPIIRKTEIANFAIKEVLPVEHFIDIIDLHQFWQ